MAKIVLTFEDKPEGGVSVTSEPTFETMAMMVNSGSGLTGAHGYALHAINAVRKASMDNEKKNMIVKIPKVRRFVLLLLLVTSAAQVAHAGIDGKATYYTRESTLAEGNPGVVTASGDEYDERAFTAAMRRRDFGGDYLVCRTDGSGRCVIVRHTDYGPGKAAARRGVVIDLSPAAFDALGGQRGVTKNGVAWGMLDVTVEAL